MVLGPVAANGFVIGLVGTALTHSIWFPLAANWIVYLGFFLYGVHREDVTATQAEFAELLFNLAVVQVATSIVGVIVGALVVWATHSPRLADMGTWYETVPYSARGAWERVGYASPAVWTLGFVMLTAGFLFLIGLFDPIVAPPTPGVSQGVRWGVGGALAFIGLIIVVWATVCLYRTVYPTGRRARLTFKYLLYFVVLLSIAAIHDFTFPSIGFPAAIGLTAAVIVVVYLILGWLATCDTLMGASGYRGHNAAFWVALGLAHLLIYTTGVITSASSPVVVHVFYAVAIAAVVYSIPLLVYGASTRPQPTKTTLPGVAEVEEPLISKALPTFDTHTPASGTMRTRKNRFSAEEIEW